MHRLSCGSSRVRNEFATLPVSIRALQISIWCSISERRRSRMRPVKIVSPRVPPLLACRGRVSTVATSRIPRGCRKSVPSRCSCTAPRCEGPRVFTRERDICCNCRCRSVLCSWASHFASWRCCNRVSTVRRVFDVCRLARPSSCVIVPLRQRCRWLSRVFLSLFHSFPT